MTLALRPGDYPVTPLPQQDRAEGPEARWLAGEWSSLAEARSATAWTEQSLGDLDAVAAEALVPNWDGYGALQVSEASYHQARQMLQSLPSAVPPPDVGITPEGSVLLEWHAGPEWAFSIVLGPGHTATYAGLYGTGRVHGKETFIDEVPRPVLAALYRYLTATSRP